MSKVVACVIARTVSKRLPLKVLRDFLPGVSMIEFLIQRLKTVKEIDEIYICTSKENVDDILEDVAKRSGVKIYRGSADEVIERMLAVGKLESADVLLRITGDNPFTTTELIPQQLLLMRKSTLDYVRVIDVPIGATAELMTFDALKRCNEMMDPSVSEYLMLFLFEPNHFKCGVIKPFEDDYSDHSLTVDTGADYVRSLELLKLLNSEDFRKISLASILDIYRNSSIELPAKKLSLGGEIKLPYGKTVAFKDFQKDMDRRKRSSVFVKLYE